MPIRYEWTPDQQKQVKAANQWILDALAKVMPGSEYMGQQAYQPLAQPVANALVPPTLEEAMHGAFNMIGLGPLELWANYRTPEAIAALRRIMAQEQRARGPLNQTPADLILRGSWFHGMNQDARNLYSPAQTQLHQTDRALKLANEYGLPGSTHATPSYVRFGEPYGISLSASPSVSARFAPDDYIHRVMPLYEGPPTERTLQLWKPEHQKRFNEAYNEALNKYIKTTVNQVDPVRAIGDELNYVLKNPQSLHWTGETKYPAPDIETIIKRYAASESNPQDVSKFNTMFSDALKAQGTRGLLYNPRRYGEYEMLMLDPKWAMPLDYRKASNYRGIRVPQTSPIKGISPEGYMEANDPWWGLQLTPGMRKGYDMADPEFAANRARLSDMFGLMPWTERINPENWQRILEQVDPAYREGIINLLFGKR